MRKILFIVIALLCSVLAPRAASAAIGCTLSNPALDLKYVYPAMTSYKEDIFSFSTLREGKVAFAGFPTRLGAALDPVFDLFDTPYTVYSVYQGDQLIGIVHGVNVPGRGGVIQIFLSIDPTQRTIRELFFQRLESNAAKLFRDTTFRKQFAQLSLADWYMSDYYEKIDPNHERALSQKLTAPSGLSESSRQDYHAIMGGTRKNLVLLDIFLFNRASDPYFERAHASIKTLGEGTDREQEGARGTPP